MAYVRRSNYRRKPAVKKTATKRRKPTSALAVAKKALRLAGNLAKSTQETKYLTFQQTADLSSAATTWNAALWREITNTDSTAALFNSDPLTGNKAYFKGAKVTYEIHMDNVNNEEETCNFTVAVLKCKSDLDDPLARGTAGQHISVIQGQTYFDPRVFKVCYYKHFTLTMGGTSPGTSGEMLKYDSFYIPMNKMVRLSNEGGAGAQTASVPMSNQDRYFFVVYTDNNSFPDLESPRINWRYMLIAKDCDINT